jgi:polysaccharide export outer membrane protein
MRVFERSVCWFDSRHASGAMSNAIASKLLALLLALMTACTASRLADPRSSGTAQYIAEAPDASAADVDRKRSLTRGSDNVRHDPVRTNMDSRFVSSSENTAKLESLLETREANQPSDFSIGAGDVLEVSVPAIDQLKAVDTRVLEDNTIMLPLLARVRVGGLTEEQAGDILRERLRQYMYTPQLSIFVKTYQSRKVTVMGAVDKPGSYTLANPSETILSIIGRAGGLNEKAGSRVFLVPGPIDGNVPKSSSAPDGDGSRVSLDVADDHVGSIGATQGRLVLAASAARTPGNTTEVRTDASHFNKDSLCIDLDNVGDRQYLNIPARPGDLIIISQAGQVAVEGWVQNAGEFNITPGMTLLGAVAAAGGELFSSKARILRTGDDGQPITEQANLRRIRDRQEPDIPVHAGDVVIVDKSLLGSGPYLFYALFTKFNTGMYMPPP